MHSAGWFRSNVSSWNNKARNHFVHLFIFFTSTLMTFFFFLNREMIHLSGNNFIIVCMWFFKLNHTFSYCAHSGFDAFHPSNCRSEDHLSCFNHFLLIFISLFLPPLIYLRLSQLSASSRTLLLHYFDIFFQSRVFSFALQKCLKNC